MYLCKLATAKYYLSIAKSGNNVIRDVFWVYSFQKDNVNVNVNLYSTSTQKITTLMCSICRVLFKKKRQQCPADANCFGTSSMSLVQQQRRCDSRTYRAETVKQQVDGGWRNKDAAFSNLSDWCIQLRQIIRCLAMQALVHLYIFAVVYLRAELR